MSFDLVIVSICCFMCSISTHKMTDVRIFLERRVATSKKKIKAAGSASNRCPPEWGQDGNS